MTNNEMRKARKKLKTNILRDKKTGCHLWQASARDGYGQVRWGTRIMSSHRLSYEAFIGEIPESSVVHHACANKLCINPKHLQLVTPQENQVEMLERTGLQKKIAILETRLENCNCEQSKSTGN